MRLSRIPARISAVTAVTLLAASSLVGCATQLKKAQAELAQIGDLLPGRYNNAAQVEEDAKAGRDLHTAVTLDIVRVDLPLLSDYAFYAQETSAEGPRKIISQRLLTFEPVDDGAIVERVFTFAEPARWRDGHLNTGLFTGMMFRDTTPMAGCDLLWKKDGPKFVGQNSRDTCRVNSAALGTVKVDMRAELDPEGLALAELSYNAGGKLVQGHSGEPFNRFQRGGSP
jgi:hypothetical protein